MNFVDLVNDLRVECGVSGTTLVTVQSLSGELLRLKNWIRDAWQELQLAHDDWKFMRKSINFTTIPGQQTYPVGVVEVANIGVNIDTYMQNTFSIDPPTDTVVPRSQEAPLGVMAFDHFRDMYITGYPVTDPTRWQRPMAMSFDPYNAIWFGPCPDAAYLIRGDCHVEPQVLTADTDIPIMPLKFHKVIVYLAMMKYAGYESANDVMVRARRELKRPESALYNEQLPQTIVQGAFDGNNWD